MTDGATDGATDGYTDGSPATRPSVLTGRVDRAVTRILGLPAARNAYRVRRNVRTPTRDGFDLVGDHYAPVTTRPRGTILLRSPYGRGFPWDLLYVRPFAARGYHVVVQSCRGTFGSGDEFQPMVREADDGQDTVAWLRRQEWFDGRLATMGMSYLGFVQWAILRDPPPEVKTSIVLVGPHDFARSTYGTGAFTLQGFLGWSEMMATLEDASLTNRLKRMVDGSRRLTPGFEGLPLPDAAEPLLRGRAPWYREWASHVDLTDPFWEPMNHTEALRAVDVPLLLIGGWRDLFLRQTLEQYAVLQERGVPVALTVGPWTHTQVTTKAAGIVARQALGWLDEHLAGEAAGPDGTPSGARLPVRVAVTTNGPNGRRAGEWRDLPAWPPPSREVRFGLAAGTLSRDAADDGATEFTYDPADPTPGVGGRILDRHLAGVKDNRELETRADVVTFTSAPMTADLEVLGTPVLELALRLDNPYGDVFVRLCTVDANGRSENFSDMLRRLDPRVPAGETQRLRIDLDPCAQRILAGQRLRLQVSGGAHPRFARNTGTGEPVTTATTLEPCTHTVDHRDTVLILPVVSRA